MEFIKRCCRGLFCLFGFLVYKISKAKAYYMNAHITESLGGGGRVIQYPFRISGMENIKCGDNVSIGKDSIIMCTRSNVIIIGHFVSGPNLSIIAGNHMAVIGKYIDEVSDDIKDKLDINHHYDEDIIIESNVWAGANVTILNGVTIRRGGILAAGAVVTKSTMPYSINGGVPSRHIKFYWTIDQILEHEKSLYSPEERYTREQLEAFFNQYQS